jgi:MYXO-CTERM domain-containing protein
MIRNTIVIAFIMVVTSVASSSVTTYTNKAAWESAVGSFTTLDFTGGQHGYPFPPDTYAHLGITFAGQQMMYWHGGPGLFPNDEWGIVANNHTLWAYFDTPQHAIAADFPGVLGFQLWRDGQLISTNPFFLAPFAGLISKQPFDAVFLYRAVPSDLVAIDDLHFASLPAPGALALFGLAALLGTRRRRR